MRQAFAMTLKPGQEFTYKQKHDNIWPQLVDLFHEFGITNYSIFRAGIQLFGYLEIEDPTRLDELRREPLMHQWWEMMEPYMEYNQDHTPKQNMLLEVFHLD